MELKDVRYQHILDYLSRVHCNCILEIGTCCGETAKFMLLYSKNREIRYYGVDLFEDATPEVREKEVSLVANSMASVLKKLKRHSKFVYLFKGYSTDLFPKFKDMNIKFDCIWIDGGHSYETVKYDFEHYSQLLSSKGIIFLDDYTKDPFLQGVSKFINKELLTNPNYKIHIYHDKIDVYRGYEYKMVSVQKVGSYEIIR